MSDLSFKLPPVELTFIKEKENKIKKQTNKAK
jgi:hypothetical protein